MARTNQAKTTATSRHEATDVPKRPKGLAKRVQFGARTNFTRAEFGQLVELWLASPGGRARHEDIEELADKLGRCPKQVSVWFSNRRQNFRDIDVLGGIRFQTEEEKRKFLWTKYRAPASERRETSESASTSGSTHSESTSEITRASSADTSECSIPEA
ncbi:hypothetical protein FRC08_008066, partial [Ceratobasidium sp. 394]